MAQLVCLGGFNNTRQEFEWGGHLLELDETKFEWGTVYELECETVREPQGLLPVRPCVCLIFAVCFGGLLSGGSAGLVLLMRAR